MYDANIPGPHFSLVSLLTLVLKQLLSELPVSLHEYACALCGNVVNSRFLRVVFHGTQPHIFSLLQENAIHFSTF
jgi:hypothetical protein